MSHPKPKIELILVAYIDHDSDEIIRDPKEAERREKAGKRIQALWRFPTEGRTSSGDVSCGAFYSKGEQEPDESRGGGE